MRILLLVVGKTNQSYILEGFTKYVARLKYYVSFDYDEIPKIKKRKSLTEDQQKKIEADLILGKLNATDYLVLLDEKGVSYSSLDFSNYVQKKMNSGIKRLVFVVGGPYGFDSSLYSRSNAMLSLSKMTFSHQMIRLFIVEQLYRAFSILKNEPYHNE